MPTRGYHVYILASRSRRLYVGVTRDLARRLSQHRYGPRHGYTRRYGIGALVHVESTSDIRAAIAREKQLKRWPRWRKDRLIEASNPGWLDLTAAWKSPTEGRHTYGPDDERCGAHRGSEGDPDTRAGFAAAPAG